MDKQTESSNEGAAKQQMKHSAAHCLLLLGFMILPSLTPIPSGWIIRRLLPPVLYGATVLCVPALRRSATWIRFGKIHPRLLVQTSMVIVTSVGSLTLWYSLVHPDLRFFALRFAYSSQWQTVTAGLVFAILNSSIEEIAWRGVILEALAARNGLRFAVFAQAVLFGISHSNGIPGGGPGMLMASVYGLLLGGLRISSGGMVLCIVAHCCADATIFALAVQDR